MKANPHGTPGHPPPPPARTGRTVATLAVLAAAGVVTGLWLAVLVPVRTPHKVKVPQHKFARAVDGPQAAGATDEAAGEIPWPGVADVALLPALARAAFEPGNYRPGELILRADSADALAALVARAQAAGGELLGLIPGLRAARFRFPNAASAGALLEDGMTEGDSASLNYLVALPTAPDMPDTPRYAPGSLVPFGQTALAFMGVPADNRNWGRGTTVAILDTGLSPGAGNLLNGGLVTEMDYVGGASPASGHADNVASLLSGSRDERGIVPGASLLSVRVLDNDNVGDVFTVVEGLNAAIDRGAKVVSLSLGTDAPSPLLQEAVDNALAQGVVLVAAVGNDGLNSVSYPAAYPGVVAVGAVDGSGQRASFSNYGPEVDVMAPGVGLYTQTPAGGMVFSGTSAAAPLVAGLIANLMATDSRLSGQQAADLVVQYANFAGPATTTGKNDFYGAGIASADRVLNRNNATFADMALADVFVDLGGVSTTAAGGTTSATVPVQIVVQNRGNIPYAAAQVNVNLNGQSTTQILSGFAPGQVKSMTLTVPVQQLFTQQGVGISANVQGVGLQEARTDNNAIGRQVRIVPQAK